MKRHQQQQILTLVVNSVAKQQGDFLKTAELITELLSQHLQVTDVAVWSFSDDQQMQILAAHYGTLLTHDTSRPAHIIDFPEYLAELRSHRFIDALDTSTDSRLSELYAGYFKPRGIQSSLEVAIRINGHLEGVLCLERLRGGRRWSEGEIHLACQLADQLALTLATKHAHDKDESLTLFRNAAEQSSQVTMLINLHTETVEYINRAYSDITGVPADSVLGCRLHELEYFKQHPELAEQSLAQIHRGEMARGEVQLSRQDGSSYWIKFNANPFITDRGSHYLLVTSNDNSAEHRYQAELERLAWRCSLTGLYNRAHFNRVLDRSAQGSLILVDLMGFKRFNDTYGHEQGDTLLCEIARRLRHFAELNKASETARVGSDEFALLLPSDISALELDVLSARLHQQLSVPMLIGREQVDPKPAIAIVDIASVVGLFAPLSCADIAIQYAKKKQSSAIQIFNSDLFRAFKEDAQIEKDLHWAIRGRQFELYYQPLMDLKTHAYIGAEALIRWHHPKRGVLYPGVFIDIAEQSGLINTIGAWVLEAACRQLDQWQRHNVDMAMHVNVSARQFFSGNLYEQVWQLLNRYRLKPQSLILEITETELMEDIRYATNLCQELSELGVGLAIDDFGTGYSSMRYLKQFPISKLKIDRSFISDLSVSRESREIVSAIIAMAKALNISLTAEGVETLEQEKFLADNLCHHAQGFLYSPALREPEFAQFLFQSNSRLAATTH
ncbi:EAL domain-containing protein [Shewanella salipaludis]|uniref:EAL domain-containing protein n=1 Tax=Shewanella salipaludis TaxID=2723052 RepID=A0A972FRE6_9GAMM|nr:EAL domain-containing protein [Shewanella salipaludis]